jgi:hypothetical protein
LPSSQQHRKQIGEAAQIDGLAGFALRAKGAGLNIGFIPLGIGSAIFAFLPFRSGYVPRLLAAWGIFASLLLAFSAMALVVLPAATDFYYIAMVPMFIYKVSLDIRLLAQGATLRSTAAV